jgi:phage replication-related protein YjqB (UPF0714/DUF867 family)
MSARYAVLGDGGGRVDDVIVGPLTRERADQVARQLAELGYRVELCELVVLKPEPGPDFGLKWWSEP